ncbi:putative tetratricopeptide-like helical domain superfamily [Helianthus anomalus]
MINQVNHVKNTRFHLCFMCSNANSLYQCNTKITRCFRNRDIKAALHMFDEMPVKNIATWNCIMSRFVKKGMVFDAHKVFDEMANRNVVSWTAILDVYAKCGRLDESRALFDAMTDKNVVSWNAMLSGYVTNDEWMKREAWNAMLSGYVEHDSSRVCSRIA